MKRFEWNGILKSGGTWLSLVKRIFSGTAEKENLLIDTTGMQKKKQAGKCHFLFVILFGLSIASALWQHGSPLFTLGAIAFLLPLAFFVYIPARFINVLLQQMFACLIFFGSCFWMVHRIKKGIALDLVFVEGLVIGTFAFFTNCTRKDYAYIFLSSMLLIIYGGLIPRKLLLYLIPGAVGCLLISFVLERVRAFSGTRKLHYSGSRSFFRTLGRTWHFYLLQILIFIPIFLLILSLIPLREMGDEGLFEVSFSTSRTSVLPPDLKKWLLQDRKVIKGKNAQYQFDGDEPENSDRKSKKEISSDLSSKEDGRGKGSPPGKDLVFTAVMPVKLYHLGTLYDRYDGKKWITTPDFIRSNITRRHVPKTNLLFDIESQYVIRKWIAPNLYAPYRPVEFINHIDPQLLEDKNWKPAKFKISQNSVNTVIKTADNNYPAVPYIYRVRSRLLLPVITPPPDAKKSASPQITAPDLYASADEYFASITEKEKLRREKMRIAAEKRAAALQAAQNRAKAKQRTAKKAAVKKAAVKKAAVKNAAVKKKVVKKKVVKKPVKPQRIVRDPVWQLSLPQTHFLQLPKNLSPRIAELAKELTKDVHTPYEKAIALRDHLRKNYKYKLYASPVPPDKEAVEYFLFEIKEGHCEYFAAALTVLARYAGLPARVATGFSPGNYNALTRQTEVYEYHAHAWSQIFIANTGWLTFDAVPPGEIVSVTTPIGIGRFRNPFGEEWRIMPPELTPHTLQYVQKKLQEDAAQREAERLKRLAAKQKKTMATPESSKKQTLVKKELKKMPEKVRPVKPTGIKSRIRAFFNKYKKMFKDHILHLIVAKETRNTVILVVVCGLIILFNFRRTVDFLKLLFYRHRSKTLMERAFVLQENDPRQSILYLYRALRLLLILARMERKKNMELLAYATDISKTYSALLQKKQHDKPSPETEKQCIEKGLKLEQDLRLVFQRFYSLEYGSCTCSATDAAECAAAVAAIHSALKELLPHSLLP